MNSEAIEFKNTVESNYMINILSLFTSNIMSHL